jgi:hypothetical protein
MASGVWAAGGVRDELYEWQGVCTTSVMRCAACAQKHMRTTQEDTRGNARTSKEPFVAVAFRLTLSCSSHVLVSDAGKRYLYVLNVSMKHKYF